MKEGQNKARAIVRRRRRPSLTWIDFLVIAATILTFAAILDATLGRAKASPPRSVQAIELQTARLPDDPGLVKARIRLAIGG